MPRKRKTWETLYKTGSRGSTVAVMRTSRSSNLYLRWWRTDVADYGYRSLKHGDLEKAKDAADVMATGLRKAGDLLRSLPSLGTICARYEAERTPDVGVRRQKEHARLLDRWQRYLGIDPDLADLPSLVAQYERQRLSEVRARQVEVEVRFLMAVMRWASSVRPRGGRILQANPLEGYQPPRELNPRRPRADRARWLQTYRYADRVDGQRFLRVVLSLAWHLGWRITAICELRASDLDLTPTAAAPYGRILKRAETDKVGVERWVPLPKRARRALVRHLRRRQAVGNVWLFPAARRKGKPWSKDYAQKLHRRAQQAAGLEIMGWHAYRRAWATARKNLPAADVAYAGGWLDVRTLEIYQQPDEATIYRVIEEPGTNQQSGGADGNNEGEVQVSHGPRPYRHRQRGQQDGFPLLRGRPGLLDGPGAREQEVLGRVAERHLRAPGDEPGGVATAAEGGSGVLRGHHGHRVAESRETRETNERSPGEVRATQAVSPQQLRSESSRAGRYA